MATFELPEDLTDLPAEDLDALEESALAEFDDLYENQPRTSENVARMREIRDGLTTVRGERDSRAETEAELEGLADEVRASDDEPAEGEDADPAEAEDQDEPSAEDDEPAPEASDDPEPAPEAEVAEITEDDQPADSDEDAESVQQEPETVAASSSPAPQPSATALNAHRGDSPSDTEPVIERPQHTIVAAANLPGHDTGEALTMLDAANALQDRIQTFPKHGAKGQMRAGVAVIRKPFSDDARVPEKADASPYLNRAADESSLPGNSLTAAGGWCAPSETLYDLCTLESTDGMISLPSVNVSRGGIRHTVGPDFRAIYTTTGFTFTEAEDEGGLYADGAEGDKPCTVVPCPEFTEDRLDVAGVCITSGILQDVAYPEMTQRFVEGSLVAHGHRLNELVIDSLVSGSDAVSPTAIGGASTSILSSLELVAEDMKYANRMQRSASLEVVFPFWARGLVRADLSNRLGIDMLQVTDAMIDAWMRQRNVNPQYVYDWQDDLADGASGFGATAAQTDWPSELDFLIYPAGTWVKGESDIITVDAIYDSVNLPQNNFTAIFTEEGWMTMKRCHDSRIVTVGNFNHFGDTNAGTTEA